MPGSNWCDVDLGRSSCRTGNVGQINYAASKSGMFGLTTSLAKEAASALKKAGKRDPHGVGITVNTVAPGFIETEMLATVPEKVLDGLRSNVPIGRLGRPEEIARAVHFLAPDASSYITGQVWAVNGGQDMCEVTARPGHSSAAGSMPERPPVAARPGACGVGRRARQVSDGRVAARSAFRAGCS